MEIQLMEGSPVLETLAKETYNIEYLADHLRADYGDVLKVEKESVYDYDDTILVSLLDENSLDLEYEVTISLEDGIEFMNNGELVMSMKLDVKEFILGRSMDAQRYRMQNMFLQWFNLPTL